MTGRVFDAATGAPLLFAHVFTTLEDGSMLATATDASGQYVLTIPGPSRPILLRASYVGYVTAGQTVDSAASQIDLSLLPAVYELPEAEVFGDRPTSSGPMLAGGLLLLLWLLADQE